MPANSRWDLIRGLKGLIHSRILDRQSESTTSVFILSVLERETLVQLCVVFRREQLTACGSVFFCGAFSVFLCHEENIP